MQVTPELLGSFPSLKPLPREALCQLADESVVRKFARRGVVLNADTVERNVCFLFEGRLQGVDFTIDGREVGLYFVESGDFCGELGVFDHGPQPEFVIALTAATTIFVPVDMLKQVSLQNPSLIQVIGQRMAGRLRQMTQQRSLLGLPNIHQRVCCQLWMLLAEYNRESVNEVVIQHAPTHMELAIMLNLSRESVSRTFQLLQGQKLVRRDGPGTLIISSPAQLKLLADGTEEL